MMDLPAQDWHDIPDGCAFAGLIGPVQRRAKDQQWVYGLRILPCHMNSAGVMHGGLMTAFIDESVGSMIAELSGRRHVTLQLNTNFLQAVQLGEFIEVDCEPFQSTTSMTFVQGRVLAGPRTVATMNAIFKAIRPQEK